jgi:hypothetical protein
VRLRNGRKVGRTLYIVVPGDDRDADILVGLVDTEAIAMEIVAAVNARHVGRSGCDQPGCPCGHCTPQRAGTQQEGEAPRDAG